jgi:hypothetical protein
MMWRITSKLAKVGTQQAAIAGHTVECEANENSFPVWLTCTQHAKYTTWHCYKKLFVFHMVFPE